MKYPAIYDMHRDGWNDYWRMAVYKTNKAMLKGLADEGIKDFTADTLALVHPSATYTHKDEYGGFASDMFATLFVSQENMGSEVLCHESVHIALAHERYVLRYGMDYGDDCNPDEERLAYFTGKVFRGIVETLRRHKHME